MKHTITIHRSDNATETLERNTPQNARELFDWAVGHYMSKPKVLAITLKTEFSHEEKRTRVRHPEGDITQAEARNFVGNLGNLGFQFDGAPFGAKGFSYKGQPITRSQAECLVYGYSPTGPDWHGPRVYEPTGIMPGVGTTPGAINYQDNTGRVYHTHRVHAPERTTVFSGGRQYGKSYPAKHGTTGGSDGGTGVGHPVDGPVTASEILAGREPFIGTAAIIAEAYGRSPALDIINDLAEYRRRITERHWDKMRRHALAYGVGSLALLRIFLRLCDPEALPGQSDGKVRRSPGSHYGAADWAGD